MTGRWAFLWARLIRNEPALAQFSAAQSAIMADLAGKRIAVIGNARSLSQHGFGTGDQAERITDPRDSQPWASDRLDCRLDAHCAGNAVNPRAAPGFVDDPQKETPAMGADPKARLLSEPTRGCDGFARQAGWATDHRVDGD
jgi:hypothetical protein